MATRESPGVGMNHLTVVPEGAADGSTADEDEADEAAAADDAETN